VTGAIQIRLKCKPKLSTNDVKRSGVKMSDCDLLEFLADICIFPVICLGVT